MKRIYKQPDITFEGFALSSSISAGCEERPHNSTDACGVKWGKRIIFTEAMAGCYSKVIDGDSTYDGLCYHNPSAEYNVFHS